MRRAPRAQGRPRRRARTVADESGQAERGTLTPIADGLPLTGGER